MVAKATWCDASGIGFFCVQVFSAGSNSCTMALGFQPGASPANTYSLPLAAEPRTSSDGVGNGARLVHGLAAVGAVGPGGPGGVCASNCAAGTASASSTVP